MNIFPFTQISLQSRSCEQNDSTVYYFLKAINPYTSGYFHICVSIYGEFFDDPDYIIIEFSIFNVYLAVY